jgi:hypothetical protein
LTSIDILDFDTVVGGDKFGNVFVLRLPDKVSQEVEDDITGSKAVTEMGQLNGAPYKVSIHILLSLFFHKHTLHLFPFQERERECVSENEIFCYWPMNELMRFSLYHLFTTTTTTTTTNNNNNRSSLSVVSF